MGLDISAYDNSGNEMAYMRISAWDYITRMLWDETMTPFMYGGEIEMEVIYEAMERLKNFEGKDPSRWKKDAEDIENIIVNLIAKEHGVKSEDVERGDSKAENPDRLVMKYKQLKQFYKGCLATEQDTIKIKVV